METIREELPQNQSDSDSDWTLLSQPSSTLDREEQEMSSDSSPDSESSPAGREHLFDDGLTEVSLKDDDCKHAKPIVIHRACEEYKPGSRPSSADEPVMAGFQALDTTSSDGDGDDDTDDSASEGSRRSSLTQSELGEYVDLGKKEVGISDGEIIVATITRGSDNAEENFAGSEHRHQPRFEGIEDIVEYTGAEHCLPSNQIEYIKNNISGLSRTLDKSSRRNKASLRLSQLYTNTTLCMMLAYALFLCIAIYSYIENRPHIKQSSSSANNKLPRFIADTLKNFNFLSNSIPSSRHYEELQELDSELQQCIKRQSPSSFKYYMSNEDTQHQDPDNKSHGPKSPKPYRGLVCYGQEKQWRKRFDKLKHEYKLDLRNLMNEAKKRVINDMLEFHHPSLKFKLILNQLEYLDFLEQKRNKKQNEAITKHLKAENLQLLNRLNQPNETGYQKLVINLELQNSKLKRENDILKASLRGRAGPAFMKQSKELEQHVRENILLKKFHHQAAQEVSKSLKLFNSHTIDPSTTLDDPESLNAQIVLTNGYLRRLSEKVSTVLIENESLKEELREAYISNTDSTNTNSLLTQNHYDENYHLVNISRDYGDSHALSTDSCLRNLMETREKSQRLELELDEMRRRCDRSSQLLEQCSSVDRDLVTTSGKQNESLLLLGKSRQIDVAHTALDKSRVGVSTLGSQELIHGLKLIMDRIDHVIARRGDLETIDKNDLKTTVNNVLLSDLEDGVTAAKVDKIIPIYIREAIRAEQQDADSLRRPKHDDTQVSTTMAPPSMAPPMQTTSSNETAEESFVESPCCNKHVSDDPEFARASLSSKQGKHKRRNDKSRPYYGDWETKRAKLREKLRRASSRDEKIEYLASEFSENHVKPQEKRNKKHKHFYNFDLLYKKLDEEILRRQKVRELHLDL